MYAFGYLVVTLPQPPSQKGRGRGNKMVTRD